jgi:hypothetical protein
MLTGVSLSVVCAASIVHQWQCIAYGTARRLCALEPVVGKHLLASNIAGQVWERPEIAIEVVKFGATAKPAPF